MGIPGSGLPRARTLGAALRQARKTSGLSLRDVSHQLGVAHSTVGRWESGDSMPGEDDVSALLGVLDVEQPDHEQIMTLARDSTEADWLTSGPPGVSQQLAGVMECERTARHITDWAPLVIPGVLQTSDYARAIIGQSNLTQAEIQTQVTLRMGRRDVFMRPDPAELVVLIGEQAIHGGIGGRKVMRDQLRHLLAMSKLDVITVRLVSLAGDWHPGHAGPFILYKFDVQPSITYLEHHRSGAFLADEDDVAAYEAAADEICRVAMAPDESAEYIAETLTALEAT